jgi:hypothetical protein
MHELAAARAARPGAALRDVLRAFPRLLDKDGPIDKRLARRL